MAKAKLFFANLWYFIRCWFVRNPKNPKAPRLWNMTPGTKFKVKFYGHERDTYTVIRLFWDTELSDRRLRFKAEVTDSRGVKEEIFLSDHGVVPYHYGWNVSNVPYFVD